MIFYIKERFKDYYNMYQFMEKSQTSSDNKYLNFDIFYPLAEGISLGSFFVIAEDLDRSPISVIKDNVSEVLLVDKDDILFSHRSDNVIFIDVDYHHSDGRYTRFELREVK